MLRLLNTKEDLLPGAVLYLRLYCLGMPGTGALQLRQRRVQRHRRHQSSRWCILSIAGVLNVVLNLFFVIVCNMDVAGVALASAISQCVSAMLIVTRLTAGVQDCLRLAMFTGCSCDPHDQAHSGASASLPDCRTPFSPLANLFIQAGRQLPLTATHGHGQQRRRQRRHAGVRRAWRPSTPPVPASSARTTAQASQDRVTKSYLHQHGLRLRRGAASGRAACSCSGGSS